MLTRNNVHSFIRENMTSCRVFWGLIYNFYFILGWVSFYFTKICNNMMLVENGEKPQKISLTVHVVFGLGAYVFLFLVLPAIYVIHQVIKEHIENAKIVFGLELVIGTYKFLGMSIFPILCVCMKTYFGYTPSLWMWIGIVGTVYCLLIFYINPDDYGMSAFMGMCMGILFIWNNKIGKYICVAAVSVSWVISSKIDEKVDEEIDVLKDEEVDKEVDVLKDEEIDKEVDVLKDEEIHLF